VLKTKRKEQQKMALKLIANYSKRLGLPGYSSHQFSVSLETEISNINDVAEESSRLYQLLQQNVDEEIQRTGFVPDEGYGISEQGNRNGHRNGVVTNGNGHQNGHSNGDSWNCSDKQRDLILKLVSEHDLPKDQVDETAKAMFGTGVKELNKLQASGLIDRIIEDTGGKPSARRPRNGTTPPRRQYQNGGAR
jgi:hypothetical protein